jgi:polar amino acid transport system substrate-binding protein
MASEAHLVRLASTTWWARWTGLVALLVLVAVAGIAGPAHGDDAVGAGRASDSSLDRVTRAGVLRWGADVQGGAPHVYEDPAQAGRVRGFEVGIAEALARALGVRAERVQNDWSALEPSLDRRTFDVILNGFEVTPARAARYRFTRPYYVFAARLVARREDPSIALDWSSLRGKRIGTLTSSLSEQLLLGRAEIVRYEGAEEPYLDCVAGRTDAVLLDDLIASVYGTTKPELRVVGDLAEGHYALALRPTDEALAAALDEALARMVRQGELEAILRAEGVWNERQRKLERWGEAPSEAKFAYLPSTPASSVSPSGTATRTMTADQAWLFVRGAGTTLLVSLLAMMLAIPLGLGLATARLFGPKALAAMATAYVELYRGTPVLLQLYVLYYGLANVIRLDALSAAVLGLGMNYAAYEAEVYRAGIQGVPRGQLEAAAALGMSTPVALRRIVLPQAFRLALPSMTNDFIALLKDSSVVSVITVVELTKRMSIAAVDTRSYVLPGLLCAGLYLAMSYPLSRMARRLETRLAKS